VFEAVPRGVGMEGIHESEDYNRWNIGRFIKDGMWRDDM
jgi:hypothetical protein